MAENTELIHIITFLLSFFLFPEAKAGQFHIHTYSGITEEWLGEGTPGAKLQEGVQEAAQRQEEDWFLSVVDPANGLPLGRDRGTAPPSLAPPSYSTTLCQALFWSSRGKGGQADQTCSLLREASCLITTLHQCCKCLGYLPPRS